MAILKQHECSSSTYAVKTCNYMKALIALQDRSVQYTASQPHGPTSPVDKQGKGIYLQSLFHFVHWMKPKC